MTQKPWAKFEQEKESITEWFEPIHQSYHKNLLGTNLLGTN